MHELENLKREKVLDELITVAYQAERLAAPSAQVVEELRGTWSAVLGVVPTEKLQPLFYACLEAHPDKGMPKPADVLTMFKAHEPGTRADMGHEPLPALDDVARKQIAGGPSHQAFLKLQERKAAGLGNILCDCMEPATRRYPDSLHWECQHGKCSFHWPVSETMSAPVRTMNLRVKAPLPPIEPKNDEAPIRLVMAAEKCSLTFETLEPDQRESFAAFVDWYEQRYEGGLSHRMMTEQWERFCADTGRVAA